MPPEFSKVLFSGTLRYSNHALNVSTNAHNYGVLINLPTKIPRNAEVVEVEVDLAKHTLKQVIRMPYNKDFDLVMPVHLDGFVTTVWLNAVTDTHSTLDKSKFMTKSAYDKVTKL